MSLILLRHTRPEGAEGRCYGRTDLPLAGCFAGEVARLIDELPPVARIVSSPLSRCRLLAEAIGSARGLPVEIEPGLIEVDFGRWENRAWDDLPRAELDAWAADFFAAKPHGGESVNDLATRTRSTLDRLSEGARPLLAVTHSGIVRATMALAGDPKGWGFDLGFGRWHAIDWP
ncbi:MAG: histidine phosphatase family protein [Paracoccaceae bacterium]